jgi:hypothetical protein
MYGSGGCDPPAKALCHAAVTKYIFCSMARLHARRPREAERTIAGKWDGCRTLKEGCVLVVGWWLLRSGVRLHVCGGGVGVGAPGGSVVNAWGGGGGSMAAR